MWYKAAIDFSSLFGKKEEPQQALSLQKPNLPDNVFEQHVKERTPKPIPVSDIWTGSGSEHLILSGDSNVHQAVSHSNFLDRVLESARESVSQNPEISQQYNTSKLSEYAYGPEDLMQRRREKLGPSYNSEDAVTEILHKYFDRGIRISKMGSTMTINAFAPPSDQQNAKIFEIIHKLQPQNVVFIINSDKGKFEKVYDIDRAHDYNEDMKRFMVTGPPKYVSDISRWRNL